MKDFVPIYDRIVIKRSESSLSKKVVAAGLVMPDTMKDKYKSAEGILIACGDDCSDIVKSLIGKSILFARYSGDDISVKGEEFVLASDGDVFGELKEEDHE